MYKLALALMLLLSTTAQAQFRSEKSIVCDDVGKIFVYFTSDPHNERPIWMGKDVTDPSVQHTLMANHKTGTWTLIMNNDKIGCVLAAGTKHTLIMENLGDPV